MPVLDNTYSLRAGILRDLAETWKNRAPIFEKQQSLLVKFLPYKNLRKAEFVWKESLPFPKPWKYGAGRTYQTLKDRKIDISYTPYELSIPYNYYDVEDDQLGDMKPHLQGSIDRFLMLPDKFIAEYINAVTVLLPSISNAYDGSAIFAAVDGSGANRFGIAGGNIITGSGAGTVAAFIHDLAACQRRFLSFLDTAGQQIFSEDTVPYTKLHCVIPNSLNEIAQKASKSEFVRTDTGSITADSNWVKGEFVYHINPYLTDASDWYCFVEHPFWKMFAYRSPKDIRQIFADFSNSDRAREYNEEALMADVRVGLGPWVPFVGIKVNN